MIATPSNHTLSNEPSLLSDEHIAGKISPTRKHLLLVAPPKSGSTWLGTLIEELLQWKAKPLLPDTERREQEIDWRPMLSDTDINLFTPHQHLRASRATLKFIEKCQVKTIILSRNLADSIASYRDHFVNFKTISPIVFADNTYRKLDPKAQIDFLIDLALPWYFNFYVSWASVKQIPLHCVRYEDLRRDPEHELHRILNFVGETKSDEEIMKTLTKVAGMKTRRNKAVSGRGINLLTNDQKNRIQRLHDYYSHIDLNRFGI